MVRRLMNACFNAVAAIPNAKRSIRETRSDPVLERVVDGIVPDGFFKGAVNYRNLGNERGRFCIELDRDGCMPVLRIGAQVVKEVFRNAQRDDVAVQVAMRIRETGPDENVIDHCPRARSRYA